MRRAWDGTRLRVKIQAGFHHCARCGATTRHGRYKDAIGLVFARCGMCREWNQWV